MAGSKQTKSTTASSMNTTVTINKYNVFISQLLALLDGTVQSIDDNSVHSMMLSQVILIQQNTRNQFVNCLVTRLMCCILWIRWFDYTSSLFLLIFAIIDYCKWNKVVAVLNQRWPVQSFSGNICVSTIAMFEWTIKWCDSCSHIKSLIFNGFLLHLLGLQSPIASLLSSPRSVNVLDYHYHVKKVINSASTDELYRVQFVNKGSCNTYII